MAAGDVGCAAGAGGLVGQVPSASTVAATAQRVAKYTHAQGSGWELAPDAAFGPRGTPAEGGSGGDDWEHMLPPVVFPARPGASAGVLGLALHRTIERYLPRLGMLLLRGFGVAGLEGLQGLVRGADFEPRPGADCPLERVPALAAGAGVAGCPLLGCLGCGAVGPLAAVPHFHGTHGLVGWEPAQVWLHQSGSAPSGQALWLVDRRVAYQRLSSRLRARLEARQVWVVQELPAEAAGQGADGVPCWGAVFGTGRREDVEAYCRRHAVKVEWLADGGLRLSVRKPLVAAHPVTGARVWAHPPYRWVQPSGGGGATGYQACALIYEDGEPVEVAIVEEVRAALRGCARPLALEPGDVLVLDNLLVAHGPVPWLDMAFSGPHPG